jgi:opacity protein-like surface antigen
MTGNRSCLLGVFAMFALCSAPVFAQSYYSFGSNGTDRTGSFEVFAEGSVLFSTKVSFQGGSNAQTQSDLGFGLGFGLNITDHWFAGLDFQYNSVDYSTQIASADVPPKPAATLRGSAAFNRLAPHAGYYFFDGPITPYVVANIGYSWVDTNIPTGPPQTGCWWDPWFGRVCSTWQSTHTTDAFTFGVGGGLRWDLNRNGFIRLGYEHDWFEFSGSSGTPGFDTLRLQFGARY